jgi:hypothetical protein
MILLSRYRTLVLAYWPKVAFPGAVGYGYIVSTEYKHTSTSRDANGRTSVGRDQADTLFDEATFKRDDQSN